MRSRTVSRSWSSRWGHGAVGGRGARVAGGRRGSHHERQCRPKYQFPFLSARRGRGGESVKYVTTVLHAGASRQAGCLGLSTAHSQAPTTYVVGRWLPMLNMAPASLDAHVCACVQGYTDRQQAQQAVEKLRRERNAAALGLAAVAMQAVSCATVNGSMGALVCCASRAGCLLASLGVALCSYIFCCFACYHSAHTHTW